MAMVNDTMPLRPDCHFDVNLPHGLSPEAAPPDDIAGSTDTSRPQGGEINHREVPLGAPKSNSGLDLAHGTRDHRSFIADILSSSNHEKNLEPYREHNDHWDVKHGMLRSGFVEVKDVDEVYHRHSKGRPASPSPSRAKKFPRYFDENETHPPSKRFRQSLFGAPSGNCTKERPEPTVKHMNIALPEPTTPTQLNWHQQSCEDVGAQGRNDSPIERPFGLGIDFAPSDGRSLFLGGTRALSEESIVIPPDDQPAYQLRQNIERKKAFTYIDTDKSGTFDPTEEARQKSSRLHKAKAAKAIQQKKKKSQLNVTDAHVMKCIVKLRFKAFGNVRNYTNDEDNWPEDWSDIDSDNERGMQEYRDFFRRNTPDRELQAAIEDPAGEFDDLTGYPVARGCRSCRKHEQYCTLIAGGTYPCTQCVTDGEHCEPIMTSTIKGSCKQCIEDGEDLCSLEDDPTQTVCDRCAESEYICEALPPKGYRAERIIMDEVIYGPDRPYIACTVCRQEKKRCSLKKKTDKPPCNYCRKHKIGCTFVDPRITDSKTNFADRMTTPTVGDAPEVAMPGSNYFTAEDLDDLMLLHVKHVSRSPTPEMEMEDGVGHKGVLTKIKTSFAHPMQFNAMVNERSDCNFCEMPLFGFTGHWEREVHVIRWYDGLGFSEVGGGHCEDNGPTRMCEHCSITRLQSIVCPGHMLQRIFEHDFTKDFDSAVNDLMSAEPGSSKVHYQLQRWCSICFSLATFSCTTPQHSLCSAEETEVVGCGLRLCGRCEVTLNHKFGGDLDMMASEMERSPGLSQEGGRTSSLDGKVRADVGLLRTEGLLYQNMSQEEQDGELLGGMA